MRYGGTTQGQWANYSAEMEAMWINFDSLSGKRFAIRPYFGGVNGITGKTYLAPVSSRQRELDSTDRKQDYLVLPEQPWLDGIATSPGVVQQFVATEMTSSQSEVIPPIESKQSEGVAQHSDSDNAGPADSSIERQMTGRDEVGGLQLQIIPQFDTEKMHAGSMRNVCKDWHVSDCVDELTSCILPVPTAARMFSLLKSPYELGLKAGDTIHVKAIRSVAARREKVIGDLLLEHPTGPSNPGATLELTAVSKAQEKTYEVALLDSLQTPVLFKVRAHRVFCYRRTSR